MSELENELANTIEAEIRQLRPPLTLSQRWDALMRDASNLRALARRKAMAVCQEHDRLELELIQDFDRRVDDALSKLAREREEALNNLVRQSAAKLRDALK